MNPATKTLVLFDFDGTLTHTDSFIAFIKFARGHVFYYLGLIWNAPYLVLYLCQIISNDEMKIRLFYHFFKKHTKIQLYKLGYEFAQKIIPNLLRKDALKQMQQHIKSGHTIYIVSASFDVYLEAFCKIYQIHLIASSPRFDGEKLQPLYHKANCYGPEKTNRIKSDIVLKHYHHIIAYGDSKGDKEMLELANQPHYKLFKSKGNAN